MEILTLSQEDMKTSRGGGRSWDHEDIQNTLKEAYDENAEDGETIVVGLKLSDIAEDWYSGTLEDLKDLDYTNPNIVRTILKDVKKAGFSEESKNPERKYAVGCESGKSGDTLFKVELTRDQ